MGSFAASKWDQVIKHTIDYHKQHVDSYNNEIAQQRGQLVVLALIGTVVLALARCMENQFWANSFWTNWSVSLIKWGINFLIQISFESNYWFIISQVFRLFSFHVHLWNSVPLSISPRRDTYSFCSGVLKISISKARMIIIALNGHPDIRRTNELISRLAILQIWLP